MIDLTEELAEEIISMDDFAFGEGQGPDDGVWRDLVIKAEALIGKESSYTSWLGRTT
jgi:hypothetical protein